MSRCRQYTAKVRCLGDWAIASVGRAPRTSSFSTTRAFGTADREGRMAARHRCMIWSWRQEANGTAAHPATLAANGLPSAWSEPAPRERCARARSARRAAASPRQPLSSAPTIRYRARERSENIRPGIQLLSPRELVLRPRRVAVRSSCHGSVRARAAQRARPGDPAQRPADQRPSCELRRIHRPAAERFAPRHECQPSDELDGGLTPARVRHHRYHW